ncbi:hypothetical protein COLU111180_04195 [Cohnella lubricantis]
MASTTAKHHSLTPYVWQHSALWRDREMNLTKEQIDRLMSWYECLKVENPNTIEPEDTKLYEELKQNK